MNFFPPLKVTNENGAQINPSNNKNKSKISLNHNKENRTNPVIINYK